jgi:hypothetical protein
LLLVSHAYKPLGATLRSYKVTCDLGEGKEKLSFGVDLFIPRGDGPFPVIARGDAGWGQISDLTARQILDRGYIVADFNRCEFAPDLAMKSTKRAGELFDIYPDADFGAVAAWAWGFHRVVDFLMTLPEVDKTKIVVTGHSRGAKAALLSGATDARIALTVPNGSGCCGGGCFRYPAPGSEQLTDILQSFPTWFSPRLKQFAGHEDELPFDQHCVQALVAPRALLCTESIDDHWANPPGSLISHWAAQEVYVFLGVPDRIGISYRIGIHEQNVEDITAMLDFADQIFFKKESGRDWNHDPFRNIPAGFTWSAPR